MYTILLEAKWRIYFVYDDTTRADCWCFLKRILCVGTCRHMWCVASWSHVHVQMETLKGILKTKEPRTHQFCVVEKTHTAQATQGKSGNTLK
jgi:hypothetical protein